MKKIHANRKNCGAGLTSLIIGDVWILLILENLLSGPKRFTFLFENGSGITKSVLSNRLKKLMSQAIIEKKLLDNHVHYSLTPMGNELKPIIMEMEEFGKKYLTI